MWIQTYSGKRFDAFLPKVEDIDFVDIAHSLAHQCRFAGHCKRFYSVAEHSVLAANWEYLDSIMGDAPINARRWALMHDAAEAYIGDIVRPIKRRPGLMPELERIEDELLYLIGKKFVLGPRPSKLISMADQYALCVEKHQVFDHDIEWTSERMPPIKCPPRIMFHTPSVAKRLFVYTAHELGIVDLANLPPEALA